MYFRQLLNDDTACASYLFGCKTAGKFAVVDAHVDLVDDYIAAADAQGSKVVAVNETHVQADHISGLPQLVERPGGGFQVWQTAGLPVTD
jgi:hydroxyacylglutathione hydrolase